MLAALVAAVLALVPAGSASAGDGDWCSFSGLVKLDGKEVPDGTVITAQLDGREYTNLTPARSGPSTYSITIHRLAGESFPDGSVVTFRVGKTVADQSAVLRFGETVRLDLTASSSSTEPGAGTPVWVTAGIVAAGILLLLLVSSVGYIFWREWGR
ncbi:MAG: hypothetical protein IBX68_06485 [Dehalococcoidia bacterium]|nr:hypothetical protein [Dehalococcoidia bacterium]